MSFRVLSPRVRVWGQLGPEDVARARDLGIRRLISNRPDGEEPGQPPSAEVEAWARDAGLDYVWIPIRGRPSADDVKAVAGALADEAPALMFCRSGMRSAAAWAMASVAGGALSADEARAAAVAAGYDLSGLPL